MSSQVKLLVNLHQVQLIRGRMVTILNLVLAYQ